MIDWSIFLLRVVSGYLFILSGGLKLFGWFGLISEGTDLPTLIVTAGVIELIAGTLIVLGLFTRIAAFVSSGQMAVAYFYAHAPNGFWYAPVANEGQPAVLLSFIFLFLAAYGAGIYSLDSYLQRRSLGSS